MESIKHAIKCVSIYSGTGLFFILLFIILKADVILVGGVLITFLTAIMHSIHRRFDDIEAKK